MASDKPVIHQEDHRPPGTLDASDPGGADPITWLRNISVSSLFLYASRTNMGSTSDPDVTVPTYNPPGSFGTYTCEWRHKLEPTDTSWYELNEGGTPSGSAPWDSVVLDPGMYFVNAWELFVDDGNSAWLGAQLIVNPSLGASPTDVPNKFVATTRLVDDTLLIADLASSHWTGQFQQQAPLYVEAGKQGEVFVEIFHRNNYTITAQSDWTLQIVKLA